MEIEIDYYILVLEKKMGDGSIIPKNQKLILIKKEDEMFFFETHQDDHKKLFWANIHEVEFVDTSLEDWTKEKINERNKYINGEFI